MRRLILILALMSSLGFAQEIRRPTLENDAAYASCSFSATGSTSTAMANFRDAGGEATYDVSYLGMAGESTARSKRGIIFSGFAQRSGNYSSASLKIRSAGTDGISPNYGTYDANLSYSLDGGLTWNVLQSGADWDVVTNTVTLTPTQDLTKIQVKLCTFVQDINDGTGSLVGITGYDIRTEGTLGGGKRVKVIQ